MNVPRGTGSAELGARDAAELLHAEVGYLLDMAGVPALHIKGPTVATWLYEPGERSWGDADVWVPPALLDHALAVLAANDFASRWPGVNHRTTRDHAVVVARPRTSAGGGEVDVHHRFPGVTIDTDDAFDVVWRRRVEATLAHTAVWFPDHSTRALLAGLHAARSPGSEKAEQDVVRLARAEVDWADVSALAAELGAGPGLHAGLALVAEGREVLRRHPVLAVPLDPEWRLRTAHAPLTSLRLLELQSASWQERLALLAHWALPAAGVVRMRDPRADQGRVQLARAYVRRWREGAAGVPAAARHLRKATRR